MKTRKHTLFPTLAPALVLAAVLTLGACQTTGNRVLKDETSQTLETKLTPGMAKTDVQTLFGDPITTTYTNDGSEIWTYSFSRLKPSVRNFIPYYNVLDSASKGKAKTLSVFFSPDQVLERHSLTVSDIESRSGLLN